MSISPFNSQFRCTVFRKYSPNGTCGPASAFSSLSLSSCRRGLAPVSPRQTRAELRQPWLANRVAYLKYSCENPVRQPVLQKPRNAGSFDFYKENRKNIKIACKYDQHLLQGSLLNSWNSKFNFFPGYCKAAKSSLLPTWPSYLRAGHPSQCWWLSPGFVSRPSA